MFIAMNQFQVDPARAEEFEQVWRERESHLSGFDGFIQFALLKGDEPGDYISTAPGLARHHAWAQSDAFRRGTASGCRRHHRRHPRARFARACWWSAGWSASSAMTAENPLRPEHFRWHDETDDSNFYQKRA
jgi:heme-degrading monooxygenase HmoA